MKRRNKYVYELQYLQGNGRHVKSMTQKSIMKQAVEKAILFNRNIPNMNYRVVKKLGRKTVGIVYPKKEKK